MGKKRILAIGDGAAPTGFSTVMTNILKRLPQEEFEIHHLAINYKGDPHNNSWKMYPAGIGGDPQGFGRLPSLLNNHFDCIFMLNDVWVINKYLTIIGERSAKIPPAIVYFPVDASKLSERFFNNFELVTKCCTYTEFAKKEVLATRPDLDVKVINHGLDTTVFYKLDGDKRELKKQVLGSIEDVEDSFIVLFAQRNQPRKRLDISIKAFSMFAENKPKNVQLWTHCGIKDMGIDLLSFSHRYGVDSRLITSDHTKLIQNIPEQNLNVIYNITDTGLNSSTGEGWGLVNFEHAVTGAPQVVADHSSLTELYSDCGLLVPTVLDYVNMDSLTEGRLIRPEDMAESLEKLYTDKELYDDLSKKSIEKFSRKEYNWDYIVEKDWLPLFRECTQ